MSGWLFMVSAPVTRTIWVMEESMLTVDVVVDFFNHLNMLYGTVTEFCTVQEVRHLLFHFHLPSHPLYLPSLTFCVCSAQSCPQVLGMSTILRTYERRYAYDHGLFTGCRYEYLWEDGVRYKKPTKLPAPEYVDALMNWAQGLLDNEDVFPNKIGTPSPLSARLYALLETERTQAFRSQRTSKTRYGRCSAGCSGCTRTYTATTLTIYARWGSKVRKFGRVVRIRN